MFKQRVRCGTAANLAPFSVSPCLRGEKKKFPIPDVRLKRYMADFDLKLPFELSGDQPGAIDELVAGFKDQQFQTLLGVTGSGKTVTMANVIARHGRPALVMSHNKTLAAQL